MSGELTKHPEELEPTKIDSTASDACTRSGAFALLLSMALFSLIPYWLQEHAEISAGRYLSLRLNLTTAINQLDSGFYWQQYKASHDDAESMSIEQLLNVRVESPPSRTTTNQGQPKPAAPATHKLSQPDKPSLKAPIGLRVSMGIYEIRQIADFLTNLNDSDLLTSSRRASGLFEYTIYRWALKRDSLIERSMLLSTPATVTVRGDDQAQQPDSFVPARSKEELLKYLTLRDVRELAHYELPKIEDTIKLGGRGGKEIEVTPGALPRNLYMASVFAEILLLFVIMYFRAFAAEAVSSAAFPVTGTLFGAFSRSFLSTAVFFLGLWIPFLASLFVAAASRKWPLMVLSALIFLAVLSVQLGLQRKSFFKTLNWKGQKARGAAA